MFTRDLMDYAASYEGGAMAKHFALALFAGLRSGPDGELLKLERHPGRAKLIDLARGVIHVQPEISKTGKYRQTTICPVLHQWITRFDGEIWPTNADRMVKHIRARFDLAHNVLRHSFFSYVAITSTSRLPPKRKHSGKFCRPISAEKEESWR